MLARFGAAPVARLATVDDHQRPHLVPLVFALDGRRVYSAVDTKPKRSTNLKRLRNIASHSHVSLLVDHYEDDWTQLWWVRVDGRATTIEGDGRQRGLDLLAEKYSQYRADPPPGPMIVVDVEAIKGWSAS